MRTTIILKDRLARQLREIARKEDRKLSNVIGLLVAEALEERERAAHRVQHLGTVLTRLRGLASPEEHRRSGTMLREELDA